MRNWTIINNKLLVRRDDPKTQTEAGLVLPEKGVRKPTTGVIVALDMLAPAEMKEGARVLFSQFAGLEIEVDGELLLVLDASEVIGVLPEEA